MSDSVKNVRDYLSSLSLRECAKLKGRVKNNYEHQRLEYNIQTVLDIDEESGDEGHPAQ
jgi:hypothetical protein